MDFKNRFKRQFETLDEGRWFLTNASIEAKVKVLDFIADKARPEDVQHLLPYVFNAKHKTVQTKTAECIAHILDDHQKEVDWLRLYQGYRHYYEIDMRNRLKAMAAFRPELAVHLLGLASLSYNGYVREEALDALDDIPLEKKLPYILLRQNDWVHSVRKKACAMLENLFPKVSLDILIKNHKLIEWLERSKRYDLSWITQIISEKICDKSEIQNLFFALKSAKYKQRMFCLKRVSNELSGSSELMEIVLQDKAPEVRQWAARHLPEGDQLLPRIERLLSDKAIRVRAAAIKRIPRYCWKGYTKVLTAGIFDDCRSIREYSRFALKQGSAVTDFANLYREQLKNQSIVQAGTISGLGETGSIKDVDILRSFLNDGRSKIRAATFLALHKLRAEGMENDLISGLNDSGKVRRVCASILIENPPSDMRIIQSLSEKGSIGSRKEATKVLISLGGLIALRHILLIVNNNNEALREFGLVYLNRWHQKYSTAAWFPYSSDELDEVIALWQKLKKKFEHMAPDLEHLLDALK